MDKTIRSHLGSRYKLVGVRIVDKSSNEDVSSNRPKKKVRFCEMVRRAADGESFTAAVDDFECMNPIFTLGFEKPEYVDVQPRIMPANTKAVKVAPVDGMKNPDIVLAILNPKQAMDVSAMLDGIDARFSGSLAVCGEATAKPYMDKKPNLTLLCGGARTFADYKDSDLILGAPLETFKKIKEYIEKFSKTCAALCGCKTSDIPPRIIESFKKEGFEKGTDYFFGKVKDQAVRVYLNKDFEGRIKYVTLHLPIKGEVKVKGPIVTRKRGKWTDVSVTLGTDGAIDLNTGKGLVEAIEDVIEKVEKIDDEENVEDREKVGR